MHTGTHHLPTGSWKSEISRMLFTYSTYNRTLDGFFTCKNRQLGRDHRVMPPISCYSSTYTYWHAKVMGKLLLLLSCSLHFIWGKKTWFQNSFSAKICMSSFPTYNHLCSNWQFSGNWRFPLISLNPRRGKQKIFFFLQKLYANWETFEKYLGDGLMQNVERQIYISTLLLLCCCLNVYTTWLPTSLGGWEK